MTSDTTARHCGRRIVVAVLCCLTIGSAAAAQQRAYVSGRLFETCELSPVKPDCTRGVIRIVDTSTNQVVGSIDVWRTLTDGLAFHSLVMDPSGQRLYAVLSRATVPPAAFQQDTLIRVFDTRTFAELFEVTVPAVSRDCVFAANGTRLFCGLEDKVVAFDPDTLTPVAEIPGFPGGLAVSPSGDRLYVSRPSQGLFVYDSATAAPLASIALPAAFRVAVSRDGSHLYASVGLSVADIDTATSRVVGIIPDVSFGSNDISNLAVANGKVYATTGGGISSNGFVTIIDRAIRAIITQIPVDFASEVVASQDESRVFVSGFDVALTTIDTTTNRVVGTTRFPGGPGSLALSPPPPGAQVIVDTPTQGARVEQPFTLSGWAAEVASVAGTTGIDAVHVWAFPASGGSPTFIGAAEYGHPRADVAALFGSGYVNSGYVLTVRGLVPGAYTLTVFAHAIRTGTFSVARQVPVVVASSLRMAVDAPTAGASVSPSFVVAGWALDATAADGAGIDAVHVWAYPTSGTSPIFVGAATVGTSRPDVATAFGAQFGASGFALTATDLLPGTYTLIVYAHQSSTGTFAAERAVTITVTAPQPFTVIDVPAANAAVGTGVRLAGWAIEFGAASGTGVDAVHVWAYPSSGGAPVLIGVAEYGIVRTDVGAIFGSRYSSSGFEVTGTLAAGGYNIVAFAHSTTTQSFRGVQSVTATVR